MSFIDTTYRLVQAVDTQELESEVNILLHNNVWQLHGSPFAADGWLYQSLIKNASHTSLAAQVQVKDLEISTRLKHALMNAKITNLDQLLKLSDYDLRWEVRGVGNGALKEIQKIRELYEAKEVEGDE